MPAGNDGMDSQWREVYARARAARARSRGLAWQLHTAQQKTAETLQLTQDAQGRAEQLRQRWLVRPARDHGAAS